MPQPASWTTATSMRSHACGEADASLIDHNVQLCGWVERRRDHGGIIFVDLRDRLGLVQLVVDPAEAQAFAVAERLHTEDVLQVEGVVRRRPAGTENERLATGEVEVAVHHLAVLAEAHGLPFTMDEEVSEALRLRYRYLDLRRPDTQRPLLVRAQAARVLRRFLDEHGFLELETPVLTRSTPEGARDYLVPSRTHPGSFFALPQSPQLFKQLFMVGGLDRYYQIVRCFRDEDLRADRQPEFTQLDMEMAFVNEADVMALSEAMIRALFQEVLGVSLPEPFPRMSHAEAMARYGSDRPDLRNPLEMVELAPAFKASGFKVFAEAANATGSRLAAMRVPGGGGISRSAIDQYTDLVASFGAKGLAYIKINPDGTWQSPILKFLSETEQQAIAQATAAAPGDIVFFGAGPVAMVHASLGALRLRLGEDLGLSTPGWYPLWVCDFPMFEWDEKARRWTACHHPFTAPQLGPDEEALLFQDPGAVRARAYDMVLNGTEIGGGSIRTHEAKRQQAVFQALGLDEAAVTNQFGFFLHALSCGAPPHGGIAFGFDRLIMLMTGAASLREVIAFPKTQSAHCPLTDAPGPAAPEQLVELGLRLAPGLPRSSS